MGSRPRPGDGGANGQSPAAVVMEEPLQLMLEGETLSVVMRTPGADIELALGLLFAEGVLRSASDVKLVRISAEAGEKEPALDVDASLMESNQVDVQLAVAPARKPERSMLSSSACGVCGAVMIEDLRRGLAPLAPGMAVDAAVIPPLADALRARQGGFEKAGGLHAAGLFSPAGGLLYSREDVGRHDALGKVGGR